MFFTKYVYRILDLYRTHLELVDTIAIGFAGTTSEKSTVFTNEVSEDVLLFSAGIDFSNAQVTVRIRSQSPQYDWMANDDPIPIDTPVNSLAGVFSQVMPNLPLIQPYFLKKQGRLQMTFTNGATVATTGGNWTWRGLRLTNPLNGSGWDYSMGF